MDEKPTTVTGCEYPKKKKVLLYIKEKKKRSDMDGNDECKSAQRGLEIVFSYPKPGQHEFG